MRFGADAPSWVVASQLVAEFGGHGLNAKIFGGCAMHMRGYWGQAFGKARACADVDIVLARKDLRSGLRFLEAEGVWVEWYDCNAADNRQCTVHVGGRRVDLYSDPLYLNQTIRLGRRLSGPDPILQTADLLCTKLQAAFPRPKDVLDAVAILATSAATPSEGIFEIELTRVVEVVTSSWRFRESFRRFSDVIEGRLREFELTDDGRDRLSSNLADLRARVEASNKSLGSRLGTPFRGRRWYRPIEH